MIRFNLRGWSIIVKVLFLLIHQSIMRELLIKFLSYSWLFLASKLTYVHRLNKFRQFQYFRFNTQTIQYLKDEASMSAIASMIFRSLLLLLLVQISSCFSEYLQKLNFVSFMFEFTQNLRSTSKNMILIRMTPMSFSGLKLCISPIFDQQLYNFNIVFLLLFFEIRMHSSI